MLKLFVKAVKQPKKAIRFLEFIIKYRLKKKSGILIFIGMDPDGMFNHMYHGFESCYGFEANPDRFVKIKKKYGKMQNIHLYNVAVADYDGEVTFNISNNNNGASSSIGNFDDNWNETFSEGKIEMIKSIAVPCINLFNFLKNNNITYIDEYFSDIQGMDLEVLKSLKQLINSKSIGSITSEVTKNSRHNVYKDLPDNSEAGFEKLLGENYKLIARGWGALKDNVVETIPEDAWEMDCKWILK